MKVSLNWVKQFTDVNLSVDELVEKIGAQLGAVDEVIDIGARYQGIVIARVVSCEKHPNADKLSLCFIDDGRVVKNVKRNAKGLVQVVCGAPNVASGQLVAWIPPGATVPSTYDKDPFVLEAKELRGLVSNGMIASAKELAIGDSHEGILVIDEKARPGQLFAKVYELDDHIIDIENKMFTHRPDLFGMLGIAREIAGIQHKPFKSPSWYKEDVKLPSGVGPAIKVKNELPKLVPRFTAITMSGVDIKPSHVKLQTYLSRLGVKPINNVVDATNFVMLLTGQPLHAYDYDKLQTGTLGVRLSNSGESLKLIGGKEIKLNTGAIVITDGQKPIGLGGVMGGAGTEVDDATKNIVIECATFDMNLTRKTAMTYGLFTDAATRFTKGQSPHQNLAALGLIVEKIQKTAGGKPGKLVDDNHSPKKSDAVHLPAKFVNERLGLSLGPIEMKHLLDNVELKVRRDAGKLAITSPFWRTDIEIPEDIVEEVGRLYGFDHLPKQLPGRTIAPAARNQLLDFKNQLRDSLIKAGANEVLTYSFAHGSLLEKVGQDPNNSYHIRNALSPDLQYYRQSLTPSLLEKVHPNIKAGFDEFALFEIGKAHIKGKLDDEKLPEEFERLSLVVAGKSAKVGAAYFVAKMLCDFLLHEIGIDNAHYQPLDPADKDVASVYYQPGRSANVMVGSDIIGRIGEYEGSVKTALKLPAFCAGFELSLEKLLALARPQQYRPINRYPELEQDICLRTNTKFDYQELNDFVLGFLAKSALEEGYIHEVQPIDIFQRPDDKEHKQTTWRIILSHPERTLTTAETNKLLDELAAEAKLKLKAERI